jgi:hypothetical protein
MVYIFIIWVSVLKNRKLSIKMMWPNGLKIAEAKARDRENGTSASTKQ